MEGGVRLRRNEFVCLEGRKPLQIWRAGQDEDGHCYVFVATL